MNRNQPTTIVPPYVIRYEGDDEIIHTDEHPFCFEEGCPCMEEEAYYAALDEAEDDHTGRHPANCRCSWCEPPQGNWSNTLYTAFNSFDC